MPLSPNEIKERAAAFAHKWAGEDSERAEAQSFWNDFFAVFGVDRKRVAVFEKQVKLSRAGEKLKQGRIDCFWRGTLLVEHKSAGADLDRAFAQAADYFDGLPERDLPRYILVSDFARFRLYDLEGGRETEFRLKDIYKHVRLFGFVAGYAPVRIEAQDPVNLKAALAMGRLHDALKASGYEGYPLEVLLARLLFCLFAEDTTLFEPKGAFREYIEAATYEDGSDLGLHLAALFEVLNTPEDRRQKNLDARLNAFPYVNGRLFEERLPLAAFDAAMRAALLTAAPSTGAASRRPSSAPCSRASWTSGCGATSARTTLRKPTSSSSSSRFFSTSCALRSRPRGAARRGSSSCTSGSLASPSSTRPAAAATSLSSPTAN